MFKPQIGGWKLDRKMGHVDFDLLGCFLKISTWDPSGAQKKNSVFFFFNVIS